MRIRCAARLDVELRDARRVRAVPGHVTCTSIRTWLCRVGRALGAFTYIRGDSRLHCTPGLVELGHRRQPWFAAIAHRGDQPGNRITSVEVPWQDPRSIRDREA